MSEAPIHLCKTEDSRKHLEDKSSLPRVAMVMDSLLIAPGREHYVDTEASQRGGSPSGVPRSSRVSCGKLCAGKHANGLGKVFLEGVVRSAAQTLVDPVWFGRGERMTAEKSSKSLHQSSGVGGNDVRKIKSSAKTNDSVLPEEFGCRANSKGIVPPWVAWCVTRVLHRSEKHHKVRVRSKMRKCVDTGRWSSGSAW